MKLLVTILLTLLLVIGLASFTAAHVSDATGPPGVILKALEAHPVLTIGILKTAVVLEALYPDLKSGEGSFIVACGICTGQHYLVDNKGPETRRTKYIHKGPDQGTIEALLKTAIGDWAYSERMG